MEDQYRYEAEKIAETSINDFLSLLTRIDWDYLGEHDGVQGFQTIIEGRTTLKAFGVFEFPAVSICNYLLENRNKKNWKKMLIESKILHDFGDVRIIYESFLAPWSTCSRDFVFSMKSVDRGEDILIAAKSIDIGVPVSSRVIRGEVINSGFLIKKVTTTSSEVTYSVCVDLKEIIPNMLLNQMAKNQLSYFAQIKKAMQGSFIIG